MGISVEEYRKLISNTTSNQKDPIKREQGKLIRQMGKNFEEEVSYICEIYEMNGLARIEKTPEPMKVLKHIDKSRFEAVFEKAAQPDFKGVIQGGKGVVFDAKFTTSDRITFQVLSDYQRDVLQKYDKLGAMAFILVGFSDGAMYKISIRTWINMVSEFGRKYIKQQELEEMQLRVKTTKKGIIDFLDIIS